MSNPWTFKKAVNGANPFPYQHDTAILYHGATRSVFFDRENTREGSRNPGSIIKSGFYSAGNGFAQDFDKELRKSADFNISKPGVYMGNWNTAGLYAEKAIHEHSAKGIVLKIEVPTSILKTIFLTPRYTKRHDPEHENYRYAENLGEMYSPDSRNEDRFASKEKFREHCALINKVNLEEYSKMENRPQRIQVLKSLMFAVTQEIPFSPMKKEKAVERGHPEDVAGKNWVKGVWDLQLSDKPEFHDPKQYMRMLAYKNPHRVPHGSTKTYRTFKKFVKNMIEILEDIEERLEDVERKIPSDTGSRDEVIASIEKYREKRKELLNEVESLENEAGREFEWHPADILRSEEDYEKYFRSDDHREIISAYQFLKDIKEEPMKPAQDYNERIKEVLQDLEKVLDDAMPQMKPLEAKEMQEA